MIRLRIRRRVNSEVALHAKLHPSQLLQTPKRSPWKSDQSGLVWRHDRAPGTVLWTVLSHDVLECKIDGFDTEDHAQLFGHLAGYLLRHQPLCDAIESFEFVK